MDEKKQFYKKGWFTGLLLLLFFPVGVVLLWKYHNKHKMLNVVLSVVFGFFFIGVVGSMFAEDEPSQNVSQNQQPQQSQVRNNESDNNVTANQTEIVDAVSTEAPQTSSEELRTLFANYANSQNSSVKNRLQEENPKELYDVVILTLQTVPKDPSRRKITAQTELDDNILENIKSVCGTYLEIFDTAEESDKIRELRGYAVQLTEKNALIKKYESDNGNLLIDESEGVYSMSFYIQNALGVTADSSIDRFLLDLGVYGNNIPQSYSGTIGYEEAFGTYLPSNERCVVQPLSEYTFSQAGIYALNVIYGGEMEVVDSQGFKSFVPVYVEVSNEFVEQFSTDRYSFYDVDYDTLEKSIKSYLLGN